MSGFKKFKKKHTVKAPQNIRILYCDKKNMITFVGPFQTKSLKLKVKIFLTPASNTITVTDFPILGSSATDLKNVKKIQGTTVAKIKQVLIETTYTLYHKLNLVGEAKLIFFFQGMFKLIFFSLDI